MTFGMETTLRSSLFCSHHHPAVSIITDKVISKECTYSGEVDAEGRPHGYGEYIKPVTDGKLSDCYYAGQSHHGSMSGIGRHHSEQFDKIESLRGADGLARISYDDGQVLHVQQLNGNFHGFFALTYPDKSVTIGKYFDGFSGVTVLRINSDGSKGVQYFPFEQTLSGLSVSSSSCECS
jgi:hypothetical protein